MTLAKLLFLLILGVVVMAALIEVVVRLEIAEEAEQGRMTTWRPPTRAHNINPDPEDKKGA